MSRSQLLWDDVQVMEFLFIKFPQAFKNGQKYEIKSLKSNKIAIKMLAGKDQLRPGGTVSGPAQMELADLSMYFLLLAHHGEAAELSVTTSLTCSFLRKPEPGPLTCYVELLKHGRTLAVGDVQIRTEEQVVVAHLEVTYYVGNIES